MSCSEVALSRGKVAMAGDEVALCQGEVGMTGGENFHIFFKL